MARGPFASTIAHAQNAGRADGRTVPFPGRIQTESTREGWPSALPAGRNPGTREAAARAQGAQKRTTEKKVARKIYFPEPVRVT